MLRHTTIATALLLSAFVCVQLHAQDYTAPADVPQPHSRHAVSFELLGNAIVYSLTYDYRFRPDWSARVGFAVLPVAPDHDHSRGDQVDFRAAAVVPILVTHLVGTGSHRIELGAGPLLAIVNGEADLFEEALVGPIAGVTSSAGYRYQPQRGFTFRAALAPVATSSNVILWGGLSFGYAF